MEEALAELPALADRFEIIAVDDGSSDDTGAIADRLAAAHPDVVRVVHHTTNLGYGAAVRSGLAAARFSLISFTDGDRQFRVSDLSRLVRRLEESGVDPGGPDVIAGFRIKRADPAIRLAYAKAYRSCLRLFFGLDVRESGLCLQALPPRRTRRRSRRIGRCVPICRAAHQDRGRRRQDRRGRRAALPAHGRHRLRRRPTRGGSSGPRFLGPALAPLGQPGARPEARNADPG